MPTFLYISLTQLSTSCTFLSHLLIKKFKIKAMRVSTYFLVFLVAIMLISDATAARHIGRPRSNHHGHDHHHAGRDQGVVVKPTAFRVGRPVKHINPDTVQIAGSSLPDCSHACGSCTPCRLVIVSFVCATLEEAETCPMAYKCMCHNKSYPVP